MDLSKLPRLSKTQRPATNADEPPQAERAQPVVVTESGAEAWISIAIGVIVLLMQQNLLRWIKASLFGGPGPAPFTDGAGRVFTYVQSDFFFHDLGLGVFGIALLMEGLIMIFARNVALVAVGLVATAAAAAWNLVTVLRFYGTYGIQLIPALAVAYGAYVGIFQLRLLRSYVAQARKVDHFA